MKAFAMSLNIIIHLSDLYFSGFIILLDGIMYIINHILSTAEFPQCGGSGALDWDGDREEWNENCWQS